MPFPYFFASHVLCMDANPSSVETLTPMEDEGFKILDKSQLSKTIKETLKSKDEEVILEEPCFIVGGIRGGTINHQIKEKKEFFFLHRVMEINPNGEMVDSIKKEEYRVKNIAFFFTCLDRNTLPVRNFFDKWIVSVWGKIT